MRRVTRLGAAPLLLLLAAAVGWAQAESPAPVVAKSEVEARALTIGTPFRYTIEVSAPPGVEIEWPQIGSAIGDFQVADFGQEPNRDVAGKTVMQRWYQLVTYATGDQNVPGPVVRYRDATGEVQFVKVPDALVSVQSLVAPAGGTPATDVRDIRGPVALPRDYTPLLWIAAVGVALIGLLLLVMRRINRPRAGAPIAPRPVHELALEALASLRAAHLIEDGRYEEFYVRLSSIVREYVEARFRVRAPEMTTEEFLQAAQRRAQLAPTHRALLGQFLGEADLVKFARHHPTPNDAERAFDAGREFVRSTAPEEPRAAA